MSTYSTTGRIPAMSPLLATTCLLCHVGYLAASPAIDNLNGYGNAHANAGYDFAAIEGLDSDGDGYTNIEEILAGTYPGDASSVPAVTPPLPPPPPPPPSGNLTPPTVTSFSIPANAASLQISILSFAASDNVG